MRGLVELEKYLGEVEEVEKNTGLKDIYEALRELVDSLGKLVDGGESEEESTEEVEEIKTEEVEEIKTEEDEV